jgi:phosphoglycolate phosphatase-like HAD superfamily hydrolase
MPLTDSLPRAGVIIFDVDGTLVDVRLSYRETAPAAANRYLTLLGLASPPLSGDLYDTFKLMGGFNDDWDLTAGLLEALLAGLPLALPLQASKWPNQDALIAGLRAACLSIMGMVPPLPDWGTLVDRVRAAGGGLEGLRCVTERRNAHLVWRTGDAATTDLVQRVFAEIYLGEQLFADDYGYPAHFHVGPGLIEHERLLISLDTLESLSRHALLGIATGRTHFELAYPMARLGLGRFFKATATMSDALDAQRVSGGPSLLKPHPYLLQRAADALDPLGMPGQSTSEESPPTALSEMPLLAAYVGDAPDDILAAQRANGSRRWLSIAIADSPSVRQHYLDLGADFVIGHPDELMEVL